MDRLSQLGPALALPSLWAMAALGFQMNGRWLSQWAATVQVSLGRTIQNH